MPQRDNETDRLENFFRKAASKPDVSYNEADWKKLEARLDAGQTLSKAPRYSSNRTAAAVAIAIILFSGAFWINSRYQNTFPSTEILEKPGNPNGNESRNPAAGTDDLKGSNQNPDENHPDTHHTAPPTEDENSHNPVGNLSDAVAAPGPEQNKRLGKDEFASVALENERANLSAVGRLIANKPTIATLEKEKISSEFIQDSPAIAEKIKQKAIVELPGAEEAEERKAETLVHEQVSDQREQVTTPRLSLLLSFAPDFSSTVINKYTAPGKAFGAMVHYHIKNRWSISAGLVKNNKKYTGAGEDYKPPEEYWKYYTNGIIPSSIDGSCSILEFPVMLQYTIAGMGKNKWIAGAGVSSYLMLSESYRYNFEEPNPGAKEGWDTRNRSHFLFNMINFTMGYEHRIFPGLMLGIEPYVKIPLEEIGWSNLKLFSTGGSFTFRYTIFRKHTRGISNQSTGPY